MVFLDHRVDDDVPEVTGARLGRDTGHLGLVLHDEAPLDRQHIQNLQKKLQQIMTSFSERKLLNDFSVFRQYRVKKNND